MRMTTASLLAFVLLTPRLGKAGVSPSGAFVTSVPIEVPPFRGFEPRLQLAYGSDGANGLVGVGWSLAAGSTVVLASSGGGAPHYDSRGDVFLLDGAELVRCPTSGGISPSCKYPATSPAGLTAYFARREDYRRIGYEPTRIGGGDVWHVWSKDGTRATYAWQDRTSGGTFRWRLTSLRDTLGNTVTYQYVVDPATTTPATSYLDRITYNGNSIVFYREARPDMAYNAVGADGIEKIGQRLKLIDVLVGTSRVRVYQLDYGASPSAETGRSLLRGVQQFGSDAFVDAASARVANPATATRLPPIRFETAAPGTVGRFESETSPLYSKSTPWPATWSGPRYLTSIGGGLPLYPEAQECHSADVDGDAKSEMVCFVITPPHGAYSTLHYHIHTTFLNPDGSVERTVMNETTMRVAEGLFHQRHLGIFFANINGDRKADFYQLTQHGVCDAASAAICNCTPGSDVSCPHVEVATYSSYDGSGVFLSGKIADEASWRHEERFGAELQDVPEMAIGLGDIDGNGLTDLVFAAVHRHSSPEQFEDIKLFTAFAVADGSGTSYELGIPKDTGWRIQRPTETGTVLLTSLNLGSLLVGDVNGDGLGDITQLWYSPAHPGAAGAHAHAHTALSSGRTFRVLSGHADFTDYYWDVYWAGRPFAWCTNFASYVSADADGDGRSDILIPGRDVSVAGVTDADTTLHVYLSRGDGAYDTVPVQILPGVPYRTCSVISFVWQIPSFGMRTLGDPDWVRRARSLPLPPVASPTRDRSVPADVGTTRRGPYGTHGVDVNGDGIADLVSTDIFAGRVRFHLLLGDGTGRFVALPRLDPGWPLLGDEIPMFTFGDVNRDGIVEILHALRQHRIDGMQLGTSFGVAGHVRSDADTMNWRAGGDFNGDGRGDLAYFVGPATGLRVLYRDPASASAWRQVVADPQAGDVAPGAPTDAIARYASLNYEWPDIHNWRSMDVNADGRTDLVFVRHGAGGSDALQVFTLLAKPSWPASIDGFLVTYQGGLFPGQGLKNPRDWMPADVNGDGRGDLVKVAPYSDSEGGAGMQTWVLTSLGNGTWSSSSSIASLDAWELDWTFNTKVTDFNGDGKSDLVWVKSLPTAGVKVYTLLSAPWLLGKWSIVESPVLFANAGFPDASRWQLGDVNADGAADLVYLKSEDLPSGRVFYHYALLGTGGGQWREVPRGLEFGNALPHAPEWRVVDVNVDGRDDLVAWGDTGVFTKLARGDGTFATAVVSPQVALGTNTDRRHWKVADVQGTGKPQLVSTGFDAGRLFVRTLAPNINGDAVTRVTSSLGAVTSVSYAPSTGPVRVDDPMMSCVLPAGQVRTLVSSETTTDGRAGGGSTTLAYRYECPRWSFRDHTLLGWTYQTVTTQAVANRPRSSTWVQHALSDECGSQLTQSQLIDATGAWMTISSHGYMPVPPGSAPPYRCEEVQQIAMVREGGAVARDQRWQTFQYDEFANLTHAYDWGLENLSAPEGDTELLALRGMAPPNLAEYVVDRTSYLAVYDGASTLGRLMSFTNFCYDSDPQAPSESAMCSSAPGRGLASSEKRWNDQTGTFHVTAYGYDTFGNRVLTSNANGGTTGVTYDGTYHVFPEQVCNALNQCAQTAWDFVLAAPRHTIDANGYWQNQKVYDALGRVTSATQRDCSVAFTSYLNWGDPNLRIVEERQPNGPGDVLLTHTFIDGLGRTWHVNKEADTSSGAFAQEFSYSDASARPWRTSLWYRTVDGDRRYETTTYDASGRVISVAHPDDTSAQPSRIQAQYGNDEWTTWAVSFDERGHQKRTVRDAQGRVVAVHERNGLSEHVTRYAYDVLGRLTRVTDSAGNVTTVTWDSLGRRLVLNDPNRGISVSEYDKVGNLLFETDARGVRVGFQYDALNRPVRKRYPDGTEIRYTYDGLGSGTPTSEYIGRLASVSDPSGIGCPDGVSEKYRYTVLGQNAETTKCVDGTSMTVATTYDAMGRTKEIVYPDAESVAYAYDPAGRLFSVSGRVTSMAYDAAGHLERASLANGVNEVFSYNPNREWLESATVTRAGTPLYQASYTYEPDGLVKTSASTTNAMNSIYTYDDLHRLTQVTGDQAQSLTYNALGNITFNSAAGTYAYGDPAHPHAATQAGTRTYQYDAVGNLWRRAAGATTELAVAWNFDSRPATIVNAAGQTSEYRYDYAGARVWELRNGELVKYFGPLVEWSSTLGLTKYYYAGPRLVARRQAGATHFYHQDRLGSTRLLTDAAGVVATRFEYASYGETSGQTGAADTDIRFTGHRNAQNTGGAGYADLIYMNARFYDPRLARFVSADTIVPDPENPQALNRYAYVYNNPISNVDPTGHEPEEDAALALFALEAQMDGPSISALPPETWRDHVEDFFDAFLGAEGVFEIPDDRPWQYRDVKSPLHAKWCISWECMKRDTRTVVVPEAIPSFWDAPTATMLGREVNNAFTALSLAFLAADGAALMAALKPLTVSGPAGRFALGVSVFNVDGSLVVERTAHSGQMYSLFGHTEVQEAMTLWRTLKPGQLVIMQGRGAPVCHYGLCHAQLSALSRITRADILYYAHTSQGVSLRTYMGGAGFLAKP